MRENLSEASCYREETAGMPKWARLHSDSEILLGEVANMMAATTCLLQLAEPYASM